MKYIKKPISIEAIQWTGSNFDEISAFMGEKNPIVNSQNQLVISTLEGDMRANVGSYIIKGVEGEFYPCHKDIFESTYIHIIEHKITCNNCAHTFLSTNANIYYDAIDNKYRYWEVCPVCGIKNNWEA